MKAQKKAQKRANNSNTKLERNQQNPTSMKRTTATSTPLSGLGQHFRLKDQLLFNLTIQND